MTKKIHALIADIGATNSRVAVIYVDDLTEYHSVKIYGSSDFNSPDEIIRHYCAEHNAELPNLILLAIAAPVDLNDIQFVNNHWAFKLTDIQEKLLPAKVCFFNDVEMLGYALPYLPDTSLLQVGDGVLEEKAPKLALSLGSGVGTSLVVFHHDWLAIPSEGGHSAMMMGDDFIRNFWDYLKNSNKKALIIEDFIAGRRGIPQLIDFLTSEIVLQDEKPTPMELVERLINKKDAFAVQLFTRYCAMIGEVAKNYTLITGAKSVYLAGGIIPRFLEFFAQSEFRASFEASSSVGQLLEKIPTFVVTDPYPALTGLTRKVAYMEDTKE
ncbi:glucokinase [Wohlfahrtiimonas larvae]|uniref:glucokinase n=1 Tax=Wohlfahrtiimonas larvae TaxID=1157986 RepID=UPI001FE9F4A6|nr:glucokinase [Wohlfahrtiimonas larvae]